jgi:MFS family permease
MTGRIPTIQLASIFWITGSAISVILLNIWTLIAGRVVKGLSIGMLSACIFVYVIEVLPAHKRGLGSSTLQWCLTWGIMLMFYISYLCLSIEGEGSFRAAWTIEGIPGIILFILSFLLPESPKWLASKGRWQEATTVMENLRLSWEGRKPVPFENLNRTAAPQTNLETIQGVIDQFENNARKCTYADLLRPNLRYHLLTAIVIQSVVQLSGIGVLMYYLVFICEMIGLQGESKIMSASIQYVINVIFTIIPIIWLDKTRRKDVLVYGSSSLGVCITLIGVIMGVYGHEVPPIDGNESIVWEIRGTPGSVCLALCFLFVAIFAASLSCAAWLYTNEILPSRAKAKGSAIGMSVSWSLSFLLTFLAPFLLSTIKWGTFLIFGAFCFAGAVIMAIWFPETYQLNEKQIDNIFNTAKLQEEIELENQDNITSGSSASNPHSEVSRPKHHSVIKLVDEPGNAAAPMGKHTRRTTPDVGFLTRAQEFTDVGAPVNEDSSSFLENTQNPGVYRATSVDAETLRLKRASTVTGDVGPSIKSREQGGSIRSDSHRLGTENSSFIDGYGNSAASGPYK